MSEEWRPVVGVCGYEVSDAGRVRNAATGRVLKQHPAGHSGRYLRVHLGRANRNRLVHRLVAEAFIGPSPGFEPHDVDHLDFDPSNNHVRNLRWLSKSMNSARHAVFGRRVGGRVIWVIPADEPEPEGYEYLTDEEYAELVEHAKASWS